MHNKFSFYSIVVQTVAPKGSSATEGLKEMHIGIEIVFRLNSENSELLDLSHHILNPMDV